MPLTRGTQSERGTDALSGTPVLAAGAYTPWWDQESSSSATPLHFSDLWKSQRQSAEPCHSSASHGALQAGKHCVNCWCHQNYKYPLRKQFHHLGKLYNSRPPSEWLLKHFEKDFATLQSEHLNTCWHRRALWISSISYGFSYSRGQKLKQIRSCETLKYETCTLLFPQKGLKTDPSMSPEEATNASHCFLQYQDIRISNKTCWAMSSK